MKKITLKIVETTIRIMGRDGRLVEGPIVLDYADLLLIILDTPPREGFSVKTMRERLPLVNKIEQAQSESTEDEDYTILFEDAQHKALSALVDSYSGFKFQSYALVEFSDAVLGAPDVDVEAVEK